MDGCTAVKASSRNGAKTWTGVTSSRAQDMNQIRTGEKLSIAQVLSRLIPESVERWQLQRI